MFVEAYKRAFSVLGKKPMTLWGLSLLAAFLGAISILLTIFFLPAGIAFNLVLSAGLAKVYLDGLDEKTVNANQLFSGFKRFWSVAGGMAWKALWVAIWSVAFFAIALVVYLIFNLIGTSLATSIIRSASSFSAYNTAATISNVFDVIGIVLAVICGIVGVVFATIKAYSYAFVPYILMERTDVSATEALRLSIEETKGKRGQMFLADFVFGAAVGVVSGVLSLFSNIPYLGGLFAVISLLFFIIISLFSGIFQGLYAAAFYKMPKPAPKMQQAPYGGQPYANPYGQPYNGQYGAPQQAPQQWPQQPPQAPQQAPQQPPQQGPFNGQNQ